MGTLLAALRGFRADVRGYQRLASSSGLCWSPSVWPTPRSGRWRGGSATGAVSWRKPTTFGVSFGLTTVTLGWVGGSLPVRRTVGWVVAGLLGAATTYEVAWVTVQHARGVPAHFNDTK